MIKVYSNIEIKSNFCDFQLEFQSIQYMQLHCRICTLLFLCMLSATILSNNYTLFFPDQWIQKPQITYYLPTISSPCSILYNGYRHSTQKLYVMVQGIIGLNTNCDWHSSIASSHYSAFMHLRQSVETC